MKMFWDQDAADAGDNPYFPEFLYPDDPGSRWRAVAHAADWFVYTIHIDRSRTPLYVGFTSDVSRRLNEHRKTKAWWSLIDKIIVDCFDSRAEALEHESHVIERRRPFFNIAGNVHG